MRPLPRTSLTYSRNCASHQGIKARSGLVQEEKLHVTGQSGHQRNLLPVALGVGPAPYRGVQLEALDQAGSPPRVEPAAKPSQEIDHLTAGEGGPQRHVAGDVRQTPVQIHSIEPRVTAKEADGPGIGA